jgi:hypothetical protein
MASPTVDKTSGKPRRKRRWLQFGLATLLGLVTLVAIVLGLVVNRAELQRHAVAFVEHMGGSVAYDDEAKTRAPAWVRNSVGEDFFPSLIGVYLDGTQVTDAGLVHLKWLTGLRSLNLGGTQVSDAGLVHIEGLTGLQWMSLAGTRVSDAGLVNLKGLTGLHMLNLGGTQVTDAGLVHLKGLTGLQVRYLDGTRVSHGGVAELRAGLPNCFIYGK